MKIAHILAQKPSATGSGIYLSGTIRAFAQRGAVQALVAGIGPDESYSFPEGVRFFPVVFESESLPFPVCGMSDQMPYKATRYRDLSPEMVAAFRAAFDAAVDEMLAFMQPDLVICHHLYLLTAHVAKRSWPCPVVGISHNTDIRQFQHIPLERDAIRAGIQKLSRVFALTGAQAGVIAETFQVDPAKIEVLGTGYNEQVFFRTGRPKKSHGLLYVGKIWRAKGVPNLLCALNQLPPRFNDLHLKLIGGYSNRQEYDEIVAEGRRCRRSHTFCGVVPQDFLMDAYNEAEVFVLPSFSEGLPLVVLEALACGCKVVVSDLPGIREWLDASAPDAPVFYVHPPVNLEDGSPKPEEYPRFEEDLARAIKAAFDFKAGSFSVKHLSWNAVCSKLGCESSLL